MKPRGAHVSISGISGVATKTSFALFLLHSIFRGGALPNAHNAKALVFSVKPLARRSVGQLAPQPDLTRQCAFDLRSRLESSPPDRTEPLGRSNVEPFEGDSGLMVMSPALIIGTAAEARYGQRD